jgi:hypothetical protein
MGAAARAEGCEVVVVARPRETIVSGLVYTEIGRLVQACIGIAS